MIASYLMAGICKSTVLYSVEYTQSNQLDIHMVLLSDRPQPTEKSD